MSSANLTLRDRQVASIKQMLDLNQDGAPETDGNSDYAFANGQAGQSARILTAEGEPIWKVLVFDNLGRDVISSVLRVDDLRERGVTNHLYVGSQLSVRLTNLTDDFHKHLVEQSLTLTVRNINSTRQPIPDVPAIYFVEPKSANFQLITSDLSRNLYSSAYINFLTPISRLLLEDFVSSVASTGTAEQISQIYDQYLNFVVNEPDLFSLQMGNEIYWAMNSAQTSDEELDAIIDRIVSGLFSVSVTMGALPIIRCPKGGAAEMISAKLDRKLRDHMLNSKDNLFSSGNQRNPSAVGAPLSRPVLIIVDRNVDLIPMLSHAWTYQSLVHDVLAMELNRITVDVHSADSGLGKASSRHTYDLTSKDFFWRQNAGVLFPEVAQSIDTELTKYKDETAEIMRKTGASSFEDLQNETSSSTAHLKSVMNKLPELKERKSYLDMHMTIATALLNGIKERQLDTYVMLEENITKQSKAQVLGFIKDSDKGKEPLDKLRLFIIWFLSTEQEISRADMEQFEEALQAVGADTTSLAYIRRVRELTRMTMLSSSPAQPPPSSASHDLFRGFSAITGRLTERFKEAGLGANFENLISGVKNFLPADKDLTLTKIAESLMDPQHASSSAIAKTEGFLYFDPRSTNARGTLLPSNQARSQQSNMPGGLGSVSRGIEASFGQRRQGFSEAIVFTVGGGSMEEYGNLQEWASRTSGVAGPTSTGPRKRIVYGSTELVNARDFISKELTRLGKEG